MPKFDSKTDQYGSIVQRKQLLFCLRCATDSKLSSDFPATERAIFTEEHRNCFIVCCNCQEKFDDVRIYNIHLDECNSSLPPPEPLKKCEFLIKNQCFILDTNDRFSLKSLVVEDFICKKCQGCRITFKNKKFYEYHFDQCHSEINIKRLQKRNEKKLAEQNSAIETSRHPTTKSGKIQFENIGNVFKLFGRCIDRC